MIYYQISLNPFAALGSIFPLLAGVFIVSVGYHHFCDGNCNQHDCLLGNNVVVIHRFSTLLQGTTHQSNHGRNSSTKSNHQVFMLFYVAIRFRIHSLHLTIVFVWFGLVCLFCFLFCFFVCFFFSVFIKFNSRIY